MRSQPADLAIDRLLDALARHWGLRAARLEYLPEGAGSHHWKLTAEDGQPHFVRVDDLDDKDWLGDTRDAVFDGFRCGLKTAAVLRDEAGLDFVVAPVADSDGGLVCRIDDRYALSVFPFLAGRSYKFGPFADDRLRSDALEMIAALHLATPAVRSFALPHVPGTGGRSDLDAFLADPARQWDGGPYAEPARAVLAPRAAELRRLVSGFDRLVELTAPARADPVITHGEPNPSNVMSVGGRLVLIDWDTVALGPPERDVSLIAAEGPFWEASSAAGAGDLARYQELTGRRLDPAVLTLYRLRWYLDDIASAVSMFGSPHEDTADTRSWLGSLGPHLGPLSGWLEQVR